MTTTPTKPRAPRRTYQGRRDAYVYAYVGLKVDKYGNLIDGELEILYVGQTVQTLAARDDQHDGTILPDGTLLKCQPWYDLVVGGIQIVERGVWTQGELDAREQFWIHKLGPRYNHDFNLALPNRIPIPEARRQREARCAALGIAPPVWSRDALPAAVPPSRLRRILRHPVTWWAVGVLVLYAVWWKLLGSDDPKTAAVLTAVTVAVGAWMTKPDRRRKTRRRR